MTRAKDISKILTDADISGTLDVTGETTLATHLNLGDNDKIKLGASGDLEIYHDGNDSNIADVGTGTLLLKTDGTGIFLQKGSSETLAQFKTDAEVNLYHNNSKKFETTSSGVTVTGGVTTTTASSIEGGVVFNEASADVDFRVEGNGDANALFVDGETDFVGIGNNDPATKLHVTSSTDDVRLQLTNSDSADATKNSGASFQLNGDTVFINATEGSMVFRNSGFTERVRIASNGNFMVATTDQNPGNNSGGSDVGVVLGADGKVLATATQAEVMVLNRQHNNGDVAIFRRDGTTCGEIVVNGDNQTTAYQTSSDYRLKENVTYDFDATARLKQLKPCRFNFISNPDNTTVDGFLAHEVSSIVREAIGGEKDEVEVWKEIDELPNGVSVGDNKLDDDGNTIPKYQGIDQSKLVPLLVKTIQELEARITALESA